jgi:hypothetical protein
VTAQAYDARYCGHCTTGAHHRCHGRCECAEQRHRPDDRVAAAMAVHQRLDLRGSDRAVLALAWRRSYPAPDVAVVFPPPGTNPLNPKESHDHSRP